MHKKMVRIGGVINAIFVLFHLFLGYALHTLPGVSVEVRALLTMLNVGGVLFILFFALAFLCFPAEAVGTRIGRLALLFSALLYGTRAIEEFILAPRVSPLIAAVCTLTAALFVAIFLKTRRQPQ